MKRRAGTVFLSALAVLLSISSDAFASDNLDAKADRLRGEVSVTDTQPAGEEGLQSLGPGATDGDDGGVEVESTGPVIIGPDLFCNDGTKCTSMSWQTLRNGKLKIQRMGKGPEFEEHNQNAWQYMQVGSNMQRHAAIAKDSGDADGQKLWRERARVQFANAKIELMEHLKLIQSGQSRVPPFFTLQNLSLCAAALGETRQSLEYYDQYLQCRERFWTVPFGNFKLATVILNDAKGDEELDAAKRLLLTTVGSDRTYSWNKVNSDPEYRVISWRLISEIERRQGNLKGSKDAQKTADELLQAMGNRRTQNENVTCKVFVEKKLREIRRFGDL